MANSPVPPPNPLDALWHARVVMWVVLAGEGLAAVLTLAPGNTRDLWIYFALTSLVVQWVSLLTLASLYVLRSALKMVRPQYVALAALGLLVVSTWVVTGGLWLFVRGIWPLAQGGWELLLLRFTGIALAVGALGLAAFHNHWRTRQLAVEAKQSQLEALHARIRPHFLFNTLNTGAALVHQRPADAEQLLLDLADLFRAALAESRDIPLVEELGLARRYLEIEAMRFGDRLEIRWNVPDSIPGIPVPTLSIQPLVENAIRHGVEPSVQGGCVEIDVASASKGAIITIRNRMPPSGESGTRGHNIGIDSVRARIHARTPPGTLETAIESGYFIATLSLPG